MSTHNVEHVFRVELPEQAAVTLNPEEHSQYSWLPAKVAALQASSYTNQAAIERLVVRR